MGTGVAWLYSIVATLVPQIFPAAFRNADGAVAVYFEAAAVITVLVLLGQVLELRARETTSGAIKALLGMSPTTARRLSEDGTEEEVELDRVQAGDRLRVRPGDRVPVDGMVLEGGSSVDESMVTGESMPVRKQSDDKVIGGTINGQGSFVMRAEKVGRDTMLAQIVRMVSEAPRADPAAGGCGLLLVCASGHPDCAAGFRGLVSLGTGAGNGVCADRGGERADHCLSLCPWAGDANVDHGRRRAGGSGGRPD